MIESYRPFGFDDKEDLPTPVDAPRRPARRPARRRFSWRIDVGIPLLYGVVFFALYHVAAWFGLQPGGSLWYPAAGLRLGLLLVLGSRVLPGMTLAEVVAVRIYGVLGLAVDAERPVLSIAAIPLFYGALAFALTRYLGFDPLLRRVRDVAFLVSSAALAPLVIALYGRLGDVLSGAMNARDLLMSSAAFWIGDTVGILMLTPTILFLDILRRNPSDGPRWARRPRWRQLATGFLVVWVWLVALDLLSTWVDLLDSRVHWYLAFLPLIRITFRHGFLGAIVGTLALTGAAAWLIRLPASSLRFYEVQMLVVGVAATSLMMGTVVSSRHSIRRRLELQNHQLRDTQRSLESRNQELAQRNTELRRFVRVVSHDLKNPLFTMRGFLGLLEKELDTSDPERLRKHLDRIQGATDKLRHLLDELIDSTTFEPSGSISDVELVAAFEEARARLSHPRLKEGVEIEIAEDLPVVRGDREQLVSVFGHLLENALRFLGDGDGPRVEVGASERDGKEVCWVLDNGIGIDPRYHLKVFELFEQLDPQSGGVGAGLAFARRVIEEHGGRIWIESRGVGEGTRVCFVLPPAELFPPAAQSSSALSQAGEDISIS